MHIIINEEIIIKVGLKMNFCGRNCSCWEKTEKEESSKHKTGNDNVIRNEILG